MTMKSKLNIKVCGMKFPDNMKSISNMEVDYLGYIFYPPSKRYVGDLKPEEQQKLFENKKKKVGVFVDEKPEKILSLCQRDTQWN